MEIEAKYLIDSPALFDQLLTMTTLGPFQLLPRAEVEYQINRYLDTPDRQLQQQRYGFRIRSVNHQRIATLKGESQQRAGYTEREELEVLIGDADDPRLWEPSPVRDRVLALAGDHPLLPFLTIETSRTIIDVVQNGHSIAELCLDQGAWLIGTRRVPFLELEAELHHGVDRTLFDHILDEITTRFHLQAEPRSKLARGLMLLAEESMMESPESETSAHQSDHPVPAQPDQADSALDQPTPIYPSTLSLEQYALSLFMGAGLATEAAQPLCLAAAAYDAARRADRGSPARAARDALLVAPLDGLNEEEQCIAASVAALQRNTIRLYRELTYLRLSKRDQQLTLKLAAVLDLAITLEEQGVPVAMAHFDDPGTRLFVPEAQLGLALSSASDALQRWREAIGTIELLGMDVENLPTPPPLLASLPDSAERLAATGDLRGDEPLTEGMRRALRRHFEKMLNREEEVRSSEEPESVHQMRVATRRLRASLQIVEPFFDQAEIRHFRRGLRRIANALGAVRDGDVFLENLRQHQAAVAETGASLDQLIETVELQRNTDKRELLNTLDSKRYRRFKHRFAQFLTTPGMDVAEDEARHGGPLRVRDAAGSLLWHTYEELRSFEVVIPDGSLEDLHEARIAGKRLRYTIELLSEALGSRVKEVLEPLTNLQECLGHVQDGVAAHQQITSLERDQDPGALAYLALLETQRDQHLHDLPRLWDKVNSATFRRKLFELIIKL